MRRPPCQRKMTNYPETHSGRPTMRTELTATFVPVVAHFQRQRLFPRPFSQISLPIDGPSTPSHSLASSFPLRADFTGGLRRFFALALGCLTRRGLLRDQQFPQHMKVTAQDSQAHVALIANLAPVTTALLPVARL